MTNLKLSQKFAASVHTCGVAAAGSTAEGIPKGASLAGASELQFMRQFTIRLLRQPMSILRRKQQEGSNLPVENVVVERPHQKR